MSDAPRVQPDELRSIPLLRGFTDEQLDKIVALLARVDSGVGVLFNPGEQADAFYLLTQGSVTLNAPGGEEYTLRPVAVIGELGALTSRGRNSKAVVAPGSVVWSLGVNRLLDLFEDDKGIGLGFQLNLMHVVAEKIERDQLRLQDMRQNIIRTQKAMKRMRDLLLESQDTVISESLHNTIEDLIKQNRRVNYRVEPPLALPATVRFDDGSEAGVVEISRTHVAFRVDSSTPLDDANRVSAVLRMSGPEIPMTGKIVRTQDDRVVIQLDLLLDDYAAALEGYLTRVQMLDFLV